MGQHTTATNEVVTTGEQNKAGSIQRGVKMRKNGIRIEEETVDSSE